MYLRNRKMAIVTYNTIFRGLIYTYVMYLFEGAEFEFSIINRSEAVERRKCYFRKGAKVLDIVFDQSVRKK